MNGEAGILQDRIEVAPFERGLRNPQEGVRGDQDEKVEGSGDPRLHGQHACLQPRRQIAAECRHQRAEQAENEYPQQHRAFMVPPHPGDLVDEGLCRMRVLENIDEGKTQDRLHQMIAQLF